MALPILYLCFLLLFKTQNLWAVLWMVGFAKLLRLNHFDLKVSLELI